MKTMAPILSATLLAGILILVCSAPASAHDLRVTIQLTLQGTVPPDAAFLIGDRSSGDYVCVGRAEQRTWPEGSITYPVCRSGHTYKVVWHVPTGVAAWYTIQMSAPRQRELWTGSVTGDGVDHRRSYAYWFGGVPETDTTTTEVAWPEKPIGWAAAVLGALSALVVSSPLIRRTVRKGGNRRAERDQRPT